MKKLGIIGIRGLPASYGAFDQFVDQFVKYSNDKKIDITFYISSDKKNKKNFKQIENVNQVFFYRGRGFFILVNYFFSIFNFYFKGVRTFLFFGYGAVIFFPILKISFMLHGNPYKCTAIIALVFLLIFFFIFFSLISQVSKSTSTKIGLAPV